MVRAAHNLGLVAALGLVLAGCGQQDRIPPWKNFAGDPARGAKWIGEAGCGQCHEIPGIKGARGKVGPPLSHFGVRTTIAGLLPNTAQNLTRWISDPQQVLPGNAMPASNLSRQQAEDVAAYLHTLD